MYSGKNTRDIPIVIIKIASIKIASYKNRVLPKKTSYKKSPYKFRVHTNLIFIQCASFIWPHTINKNIRASYVHKPTKKNWYA